MWFLKDKADRTVCFSQEGRNLLLYRYGSDRKDLTLQPDIRIKVEEDQYLAWVAGDELADVLGPGEYRLNAGHFLMLAERIDLNRRPLQADLFFLSMDLITDRKWATRSPVLIRQGEDVHQLRAYGSFDIKIEDPITFMLESFLNRGLKNTYDVIQYLPGLVAGAFASVVSHIPVAVTEIINHAWTLSDMVRNRVDAEAKKLGLSVPNVRIEGASLPENSPWFR